jgi:hypothetical protein
VNPQAVPAGTAQPGERCPGDTLAPTNKKNRMSDFEITEGGPVYVAVRHFREGHRYCFLVVNDDGRRLLGEVAILECGRGAGGAESLLGAARRFAEKVAHRAGLIDRPASCKGMARGGRASA